MVFLTAYYGLVDLAGVRAGRAGAGARRRRWCRDGRGAARAAPGRRGVRHGEPPKWDAVRALGVDATSGSRRRGTSGFRDQFLGGHRRRRGGRGAGRAGRRVRRRVAASCCRAVAGSSRWARPTSATPPRSRPAAPGRPLPGVRPDRGRPGADPGDAARDRRPVRPRCAGRTRRSGAGTSAGRGGVPASCARAATSARSC